MSQQVPLLIAGGTLVSKDHDRQPGEVLVDGERIAIVAPRIPARQGWKLIDAAGKVVARAS